MVKNIAVGFTETENVQVFVGAVLAGVEEQCFYTTKPGTCRYLRAHSYWSHNRQNPTPPLEIDGSVQER